MDRIPSSLFPNSGDVITSDLIKGIGNAINERTYLPGYHLRAEYLPGYGVRFHLDPVVPAFTSVWDIAISGDIARVGPGRINTKVPWLKDDNGPLRPLDGLDEKGMPHTKPSPVLELDDSLFENGYSYICVRATVDKDGLLKKEKDGGLTIVQTKKVTWSDGASLDVDGAGDCPLAMLRRPAKDKSGFGKLTMIRYFHCNHRFVEASAVEGTARHFFLV